MIVMCDPHSVRASLFFAFGLFALSACADSDRKSSRYVPTPSDEDAGVVLADSGIPPVSADSGVPVEINADAATFPDATVSPPDAGMMNPADAGEDLCSGPIKMRANIFNGTRNPTYVPLNPAQIMAVVGLTEGTPVDALCSGTLIMNDIVLTAKHCTEGVRVRDMWVLFGADDQNPDAAIEVLTKHEHPDHDMTILELAADATTMIMVQPIHIPLFDLTNADIGRTLEQSGYGQTETGGTDGRLFVAEPLFGFEEADDRNLVVDGQGVHGVCFGDSGGPSLAIAPEGDVRVMGALSWGDESCVGQDRYARSDWARSWIEQYTGPTPGAGPQPCGSVGTEGFCSNLNTHATFCDNAVLTQEECTSGQVCGWSAAVSGWRCVAAAADPCGGIGFRGECSGETLSWCDEGVIKTRACGECGERCVEIDTVFGFDCQVNECGDLDYLGRCNGNVAEWCNEQGMIQTLDCADFGEMCEYVDMSIGYYCQ
jgi:hypothetical protein